LQFVFVNKNKISFKKIQLDIPTYIQALFTKWYGKKSHSKPNFLLLPPHKHLILTSRGLSKTTTHRNQQESCRILSPTNLHESSMVLQFATITFSGMYLLDIPYFLYYVYPKLLMHNPWSYIALSLILIPDSSSSPHSFRYIHRSCPSIS